MAVGMQAKQNVESPIINILERRASYFEAQELARKMNTTLPTLKEFITALKNNPKLYEQSKTDWYWLGDEPGSNISGYCKIDYEKGTIESVTDSEYVHLPTDQRAQAWSGNGPLALHVARDAGIKRLFLIADASLHQLAKVALVAPVPKQEKTFFPLQHATRDAIVREVNGLVILEQPANYNETIKILARNGLRPLTYQEALSHSSDLIYELKGKWFYLSGKTSEENGLFEFNKRGELTRLTAKSSASKTPDQKVRVYPGDQPLALYIYPDAYTNDYWRLVLDSDYRPGLSDAAMAATVVVGVRYQDNAINSALKAAAIP